MISAYLDLALVSEGLVIIGLAIALIWLGIKVRRLERRLIEYQAAHKQFGQDLASLRTSLARTEEQMDELVISVGELGTRGEPHIFQKEPPRKEEPSKDQDYHAAIERIRQGADVEELVESLGCSREEAALLIRLHCPSRTAYF